MNAAANDEVADHLARQRVLGRLAGDYTKVEIIFELPKGDL